MRDSLPEAYLCCLLEGRQRRAVEGRGPPIEEPNEGKRGINGFSRGGKKDDIRAQRRSVGLGLHAEGVTYLVRERGGREEEGG